MLSDLRYGARVLRRSPLFAGLAVASLAIGLGGSVALFTLMNAALFRSLPGVDTGDIYEVHTSNSDGKPYGSSSYADFQSFVDLAPDVFAAAGAAINVRANVVTDGGARSAHGALVSGGYFDLLKLSAHRGRLLNRLDEQATGRAGAAVISYPLWTTGFGGDANVVGREIAINGAPAVIVGVAPRGFAGLSLDSGADFWITAPLATVVLPPNALVSRGYRAFTVFARLNPDVSAARAAARLAIVAEQLRAQDPQAWTDERSSIRKITITPERVARFGDNPAAAQEIATAVLGAVAMIIAIASINLATMVMARGAARTRELNVRLALGASRARLLRQLVTESLLIAVPSAALSVIGVAAAVSIFDSYRPVEAPSFNLGIDAAVLEFTALAAGVASLIFGLAPGLHVLRLAIAEGLKGRQPLVRRRWLRAGARELLIVVQVTVSFALLVVASLFTRALLAEPTAVPGRSTADIVVVPIDLGVAAQTDAESRDLTERLLRVASGSAGVIRSTAAAVVPLSGSTMNFTGRAQGDPAAPAIAFDGNVVAPGYLELTEVSLRAGRTFDDRDREGAPNVAVVSEALARRLWTSPAAVGRSIRLDDNRTVEVIGVVADVQYRSLERAGEGAGEPIIYLPLAQTERHRFLLHARIVNRADALPALDRGLRAVDARIVIGAPMSMRQVAEQTLAPAHAAQWIGGAAGLLQLGLALMAIWGLVAYAAERRTPEIGLRLALGASPATITQLIMRPSVLLVAAGVVFGAAVGVGAATILHSEIIGLAPIEFAAALPVALIFMAIAAAAAWLPARRATTIEPAAALRQQ